jgi:hypothetical protein
MAFLFAGRKPRLDIAKSTKDLLPRLRDDPVLPKVSLLNLLPMHNSKNNGNRPKRIFRN